MIIKHPRLIIKQHGTIKNYRYVGYVSLPSLSPMAHVGPLLPRGVPVTPRYSKKYPNHSETIPVSEYHRPIYESLLLDHFETPRHVRDLIRDSEQHSVTITHNS